MMNRFPISTGFLLLASIPAATHAPPTVGVPGAEVRVTSRSVSATLGRGPTLGRVRTTETEAALEALSGEYAGLSEPATIRSAAISSLAYLQGRYFLGTKAHQDAVGNIIKWLIRNQDRATGQFVLRTSTLPQSAVDSPGGTATFEDPILDHVTATFAIHEQYLAARSLLLKGKARKGLQFLEGQISSPTDLQDWSDLTLALTLRLIASTEVSGFWLEPAGLIKAEVERRFAAGEPSTVLEAAYVSTLAPGPEAVKAAVELLAHANSSALGSVVGHESPWTSLQALEFWLIGDALYGVPPLNSRSFAVKIEEALLVPVALQAKVSGGLMPETCAAAALARGARFRLLW